MLRSSAISWSSVTDFCFSSAISTETCSGSEMRGAKRGGGNSARRPAQWACPGGTRRDDKSEGEGKVRGGEQPTRGSPQKIRLTKKRVKADRARPRDRASEPDI